MKRMRGGACGVIAAALVGAGLAPSALAKVELGYITIEKGLSDREPAGAMLFGMSSDKPTLRRLVEGLDAAAADPRLSGLVIRLSEPEINAAQVDEIAAALDRVRAAGKKVHIFTEIYGQNEIRLASHADEAIIQQGGAVSMPGVAMEEMYLAGTLEWLGLKFDRVMIGAYKGAMETLAEPGPTPAWDENITQLVDGMYGNVVSEVARGRGLTEPQLEKAMEDCFFALPSVAIGHGLIDSEVDRLDLDAHLEKTYGEFGWVTKVGPLGEDSTTDLASMGFFEAFSSMMEMLSGAGMQATPTRDTVAVVHIKGPIMDGESSGGGFMSGATVGSLTIRKALKDIEENDLIRGVIVRIDSPGGSAIASESIWQGLRRIAAKKPVYASIGSMAASGGYYIAVGADKIYVNPMSIVGSIGVVSGKLVTEGLMDKVHANVVSRSRGPMAGALSPTRAWTEAERAKFASLMTQWYDQFVARVKSTRTAMDVSKTAEGRLFVGTKAVELKMADSLGGFDTALGEMQSKLGLADGGFDVIDYPAPKSFEEMLQEAFPMASAPADAGALMVLVREALGEAAFAQVRDSLTAMMQLRTEPVVLTSPSVLIVR